MYGWHLTEGRVRFSWRCCCAFIAESFTQYVTNAQPKIFKEKEHFKSTAIIMTVLKST